MGTIRILEVAELVVQQIKNVKCPIVIYGHSMGTKIAYEVERRLEVLHKDVNISSYNRCQTYVTSYKI